MQPQPWIQRREHPDCCAMLIAPAVKDHVQDSTRHGCQQERQERDHRISIEREIFLPMQRHGFEIESAEDVQPFLASVSRNFLADSLAYQIGRASCRETE